MSEKPRNQKCHLDLVHTFSDSELLEFAKESAQKSQEVEELIERKKAIASTYKGQIDGLMSEIHELAGKIRGESESRETLCLIKYNEPDVGKKSIFKIEMIDGEEQLGELVEVVEMTEAEKQEPLPFSEGEE